ncbi:AAA family ATPase [Xanthomonas phage JGB6]|nr:AAA family ATPase [Xanthomonas phage JGB6]
MLGYGLAGSHRSGKTTLAHSVSAELDIPVLRTNVSDVFKNLGLSPKADLNVKRA